MSDSKKDSAAQSAPDAHERWLSDPNNEPFPGGLSGIPMPALQSAPVVPDGEHLVMLLEKVRLNEKEAPHHGLGGTYWNNAVLACQSVIREAFDAAPQPPARQEQSDEVRRLWEALTAAREFITASGEHNSVCEVFDLDDDDRHKECNCGLDAVIRTLYVALSAQQQEGKV